MYQLTDLLVAPREVANLLREALACVPASKSTFMVGYPFIPDCLADRLPANLGVRLVGILPSQQIVGHVDQAALPFERYHIPLQTNEGCWSFAGGVWQQLEIGKVYRLDPTEVHGAVNWGSELRLHLMIDVEHIFHMPDLPVHQGLMYCPQCRVTRIATYTCPIAELLCGTCRTPVQPVTHRGQEQHDEWENSERSESNK